MTIAFLSVLGVIVGASLQYLFTRHLDNQRHRRNLRTQAYTDYLKSVGEQAHLVIQRQSQESREIFARIADAKCRVCLYGSAEVISAFAKFEQLGATMTANNQKVAFSQMVFAMREDADSHSHPSVEEIETVLLGCSHQQPS